MSIMSFFKTVGEKMGFGGEAPPADELKKALGSHQLGTDQVQAAVKDHKVRLQGEVQDQDTLEKAVLAVSNTKGIDEVNTDGLKVSDRSNSQSAFYTVKPGDNLWKIAEVQYGRGQGDKNHLIFEANKPMLTSSDKIYPGQVLRIPSLS